MYSSKLQFDQLMKIIEVMGMIPQHMIEQSPKWRKFFDRRPDGSFEVKPSKDGKRVSKVGLFVL